MSPEKLQQMREYSLAYSRRPEIKERERQRRATPEFKARRAEYQKAYNERPGVKERRREQAFALTRSAPK